MIGYQCDCCYNIYDNEYDAKCCCPTDFREIKCYQCSTCKELFEYEENALEHCKIAKQIIGEKNGIQKT